MPQGMSDAEAYYRIYGPLVFKIPHYHDRFELVSFEPVGTDVAVVR